MSLHTKSLRDGAFLALKNNIYYIVILKNKMRIVLHSVGKNAIDCVVKILYYNVKIGI